MDFVNVQVNQHASDLRGLGSFELLDEAEDGSTNLILVEWVLWNHTLDKWSASHQVGFLGAHGLLGKLTAETLRTRATNHHVLRGLVHVLHGAWTHWHAGLWLLHLTYVAATTL